MVRKRKDDVIPMDPICPRCNGKHGIEVSGDGYEWDCGACGGHLTCAIGPDGGEMFPYHREDGSCGCESEPHTCDLDDDARAELKADAAADGEINQLRAELAAMTTARDEACNWLMKIVEPSLDAERRISDLRRVGAK